MSGFGAATLARTPLNIRQESAFSNPVLVQDLPDIDIFRVGSVYYYSTSTFAFSPGAPVLKSYDLINWTPVTHSVPDVADFGEEYRLNGDNDRAYVKGVWASSMRYRESDDKFYWMGCIQSTGKTFLYTAPGNGAADNDGENDNWEWTLEGTIDECFYDNGIFFDDDDTMYVTWGNRQLRVTQLSDDGLSVVRTETIYDSGDDLYLEGDWHYLAFMDAYPAGRIPVLAPITWSDDDWPSILLDAKGGWGVTYPMPVKTNKTVTGVERLNDFSASTLHPEWEWNHSPDSEYFVLGSGGLTLKTASIVGDLFNARNTLTHRITGPRSVATWHLNISGLTQGDRAGAAIFRDESAYIGVHKDTNGTKVVFFNEINMNQQWQTVSRGAISLSGPSIDADEIWLRADVDVTPAFGLSPVREAHFYYSLDGENWKQLGRFVLHNRWQWFTGFRFAVFNFATVKLGGQITIKIFQNALA
ncbi:glycosyl hydrolase family 43 [Fusarium agapanthi]|uniref:Glycosyl hydrolase family 43 n=1 Tax=Fusarium agapanthi TaxID=1803897 RepID=A0A9P5BHL4_9HYPO|nr:glycosyl hydrolase family 43 [Fusarium agapanthi]